MCFSATVNWVVSARILKAARRSGSIALHADALHLRADVYTSIGVLTGLVLVALTGVTVFDSIAAIVVALMILKSSIDLARDALGDIFDVSLPPEEEERIRTVLSGYKDGCIDFHRLRGRKSGADRFIDVHLVVPTGWTIDQAHELADAIEKEIGETVPNAHAVIHIDPCTKSIEPCNACSSEEAEGERRGKSPE
jgi:cation diffusion facilitator family transporter